MNRGASKREVFTSRIEVADFLASTAEACDHYSLEIHAYCVMGNHYHLLVRTPDPRLDRAMRHIDGVFTQRFHRRHGTDGPLFRGRYKAILVQADRYLVQVSRYIHLNPVQAGLATEPEAWPYSSFRAYVDPGLAPAWLQTRVVLGYFGTIGARQRYRQFVAAGVDPGTRDFYGRLRLKPILGADEFREEILRRIGPITEEVRRELPDLGTLACRAPLSAIATAISLRFDVSEGDLKAPQRGGPPSRGLTSSALARGAAVHAARSFGFKLREIAAWLGYVSYTGATRAAQRFSAATKNDPRLARSLAAVVEELSEQQQSMMSRLDP
jgi:REP element-mobilizing transposase RayT